MNKMNINFKKWMVLILACVMTACAQTPIAKDPKLTKNQLILVAGATGRTGRLIVNELLSEGYQVRAFVRNEEKAKKLFADRVQISVGDVKDQKSIALAMKDVDSVFSAIGSGSSKNPSNRPEFVDYGGTKNLAEAAIKENVKRFIMVSSRSAGKVDHFLNRRHHNVLIWKLKAENILRNSQLNYTIVRPGGLSDDAGGQHAILAFEPNRDDIKLRRITREDVARTCVSALNHPSSFRKTFVIVNNPKAQPVSWNDFFVKIEDFKD